MIELEDFYEDVSCARQYFKQGDFENAIQIYCRILDDVNPDDETVPYLYLEYANALIKNCNSYFIYEIQNIDQGYSLQDRKNVEDDLENAWDMLEICRNAFPILGNSTCLAQTHFLLGEISLLNNEFISSIKDYTECINIYDQQGVDRVEYFHVYFSMANAYEFLEDYNMSIAYYEKCKDINTDTLDIEEIQEKMQEVMYKMKRSTSIEEIKEEQTDTNIVDINANKKRIN